MNIHRINFGISPGLAKAQEPEPSRSSKFGQVLKGIGSAACALGKAALGMTPAGAIINSAFKSLGMQGDMSLGGYGGLNPYNMLDIQKSMLQEAEVYTLISNIMKLRHDSMMNAIRNIR